VRNGWRGRGRRHRQWIDGRQAPSSTDVTNGIAGCAGGCGLGVLALLAITAMVPIAILIPGVAGAVFLAAWVVGGVMIHRYLQERSETPLPGPPRPRRIEIEDGRARRHEGEQAREQQAHEPAEKRPAVKGELGLSLVAGFAIASAFGLALVGVTGNSTALALLSLSLVLFGGLAIANLLRTRAKHGTGDGTPTDTEVRRRARRIGGKCARLRREAAKAGGIFDDLQWQATEMGAQARELSKAIITLRRAARDVGRGVRGAPNAPRVVMSGEGDERLHQEYEAAWAAQERLDDLLRANLRRRRICLTQIERIEDLVDAARLQVSQPPEDAEAPACAPVDLLTEVEDGLQASREALAQVQQVQQ